MAINVYENANIVRNNICRSIESVINMQNMFVFYYFLLSHVPLRWPKVYSLKTIPVSFDMQKKLPIVSLKKIVRWIWKIVLEKNRNRKNIDRGIS